MKMYGRKLTSLDDLRREKRVLEHAKAQSDQEGLIDLNRIKGTTTALRAINQGPQQVQGSLIGALLGALGSKSFFSALVTLAPPIISLIGKRSQANTLPARKNPLERVVKDVLFGYVKWKLVQFAYKLLRSFTSRKPKNIQAAK